MGSISSGQLQPSARGVAERHLGMSLEGTQLRTDQEAQANASREGALAVTQGSTISFAAGQFAPATQAGRALIGHELTHAAQQKAHSTQATQCKLVMQTALGKTPTAAAREYFDILGLKPALYRSVSPTDDSVVVETTDQARPSLIIEHEIVWALARSDKRYTATPSQLRQEIVERRGIARTASRLKGLRFGSLAQTGQPDGILLNTTFWRAELNRRTGTVTLKSKTDNDVTPSKAIEDFEKNTSLYALECFSSVAFIQLLAMRRRMSPDRFNAKMDGQIRILFTATGAVSGSNEEVGLEEIDIGSEDAEHELVPGDQTNWKSPTFNENIIYLGDGKYFAHPIGIVTGKQAFAAAYSGAIPNVAEFKLAQYRYRWAHWSSGQ